MKIGDFNTLQVTKLTNGGCYLGSGDREIYLPKKDVPKDIRIGQTIQVFVYNDAKESLKATTMQPNAVVGDFAALKVKDATNFGAFLDWGIEKDLFVPKKYQRKPLQPGDTAVVRLILDYEKTGVLGTCRITDYLDNDLSGLTRSRKVSLLVFGYSPIGIRVIVENRYSGLIYKNETEEDLHIGDTRTGYIKNLREDGRIDISLQPIGFIAASKNGRDIVLAALEKSGGYLPLHDKSKPELIKKMLGDQSISKKIFKKVIGGLYKEGTITIEEKGIRLRRKES